MNYLYWGLGGLAAFFGIRWLAGRDAPTDADAAQQQASQPSLPMFVSGAFGGGFGGGGFGGGSGVMPALPASEFPAIPSSTINFPEMPGTNEFDVAIADYGYRSKKAAFEHEQRLAEYTFDILKFGIENPVVQNGGSQGVLVGGQVYPTFTQSSGSQLPVSRRTGDVGSVIGTGEGGSGRVSSGRGGAVAGGVLSSGTSGRGATGLDAGTVRNLFNTMSASQAEVELYRRAQSSGASNSQIAALLNTSGIAPSKTFSAVDVENWKTQRGL